MTYLNKQLLPFSSIGSKKIQANFSGGDITSDAGTLLLREVDKKIGLIDAINRCMPDPRDPDCITHQQRTMLAQRIFGIAAGYEDLNDHQTLRDDPLFKVISERKDNASLASPPTLCRLENRAARKVLGDIAKVYVETFIASYKTPPDVLILDFDATDDPVHGNQEKRFFHGYYDNYCFLPLYVFCDSHLLVAYLRPSNIDPALHSRAILKLLVKRIRQQWPNVRIIFRGDSGFCRWRMAKWADKNDVGYIIGIARNPVLERLSKQWTDESEQQFKSTQQKQRIFGEFMYAAETWDRERRVIVKAEHLQEGANPRYIVTNLTDNAQYLYEQVYCRRGEAENRIKEQQLGLFADRTSCHDFEANQFRVLLSAAAYILTDTLRREGLYDTELSNAQVSTIRVKLLKIGAAVTSSIRRVMFCLAEGYPFKDIFIQALCRLRGIGLSYISSG